MDRKDERNGIYWKFCKSEEAPAVTPLFVGPSSSRSWSLTNLSKREQQKIREILKS
jgi:hypothetical protein